MNSSLVVDTVVSVIHTMRGIVAVTKYGKVMYLRDPSLWSQKAEKWKQLPDIPLESAVVTR